MLRQNPEAKACTSSQPGQSSSSSTQLHVINDHLDPSISIVKKKSVQKITKLNLKSLLRDGHIYFESTSKLSQDRCLELVLKNPVMFDFAVAGAKIRDFRV